MIGETMNTRTLFRAIGFWAFILGIIFLPSVVKGQQIVAPRDSVLFDTMNLTLPRQIIKGDTLITLRDARMGWAVIRQAALDEMKKMEAILDLQSKNEAEDHKEIQKLRDSVAKLTKPKRMANTSMETMSWQRR